jgi:tetratricopeptide (TPR) repeat protein
MIAPLITKPGVLLFLLLPMLLTGCENPINDVTYDRYMESGGLAESEGNLAAAEEDYRRAYLNTQWGSLGKEKAFLSLKDEGRVEQLLGKKSEAKKLLSSAEAIGDSALAEADKAGAKPEDLSGLTYNLALLKRDLCKMAESEALLKKALSLEENMRPEDLSNISKRVCELGNNLYEQGHHDGAEQLLGRCIGMAERMGFDRVAPAQVAFVVQERHEALIKLGRTEDAAAMKTTYDHLMAAATPLRNPVSPWSHTVCP